MASTDERTTKPDQLKNAQNSKPGFVVQIPEGLLGDCQNNTHFHPLIVPNSQFVRGVGRAALSMTLKPEA
jgi:hypothetical protein